MAQGGGGSNKPEKVGEYLVNNYDILGNGAFGVVTTGTNVKGKTIAAKRISLVEERKARQISDELLRLKNLYHRNVLKIFEIYRSHTVLWIMMEYCTNGDLEKCFNRIEPDVRERTEIMLQIAQGIEYLHSEDIVHRDIKPANILVAQEKPVVVKLTDFDCSKFFDPDYETSCMSSNVGTPAFKAPEYFQRFQERDKVHIAYHRNVDIYAAGLTFLAMIQGNERLTPRIETAKDKSEEFQPIGQLIAERVKYKRKPLDVLMSSKAGFIPKNCMLRKVIGEMTHSEPKHRLAATEVVHRIRNILLHSAKCIPCPIKVPSFIDDRALHVQDIGMKYLWHKPLIAMETGHIVILGKSATESPVTLDMFLLSSEGFKKVREVKIFCKRLDGVFLEPVKVKDQEFLAVSCADCRKIILYDMSSEKVTTAFYNPEYCPGPMSAGEEGELYVVSLPGRFPVLKLNTQQIPFSGPHEIIIDSSQIESVDHPIKNRRVGWLEALSARAKALLATGSLVRTSNYRFNTRRSETHDNLLDITHIPAPHNLFVFNIFGFFGPISVLAVSSVTGEKKWEVKQEAEEGVEKVFGPVGLFFSKNYQIILLVNIRNNEILVIEPGDCVVLHEIQASEERGYVIDARIHQDKLVVFHMIDRKIKLSLLPIE